MAAIITFDTYLPFFVAISLIPIGFQSFVMYYTIQVRRFIGKRSFWLMIALSLSGLLYDIIITSVLALRVNTGEPLTLLSIFLAFAFPLQRSGCLLWLTRIMAKGLTYDNTDNIDDGSNTLKNIMENKPVTRTYRQEQARDDIRDTDRDEARDMNRDQMRDKLTDSLRGVAETQQKHNAISRLAEREADKAQLRAERHAERVVYKEEDRLTRVDERSDNKEEDRLVRVDERTDNKEEDRLTRVDERSDNKEEDRVVRVDERTGHKEEDKVTRGDERTDYKEEDRVVRVGELNDERDIRHTDERRRESYEGDRGKTKRTEQETKDDPTSIIQEKIEGKEEENSQEGTT